ncbi:PAS domain-containing sensor histidine kinase [bacterium]|nr:PAS domain-containing sensor histidine kinase [bacterium]
MSDDNALSATEKTGAKSAWEQLVQFSKDIMYLLSPEGRFIDCNQSFYASMKLDRKDVVGRHMTELVSAEDEKLCGRVLRSIVEQRRTERTTRSFKSRKGSAQVFEVIETPIMRNGEVIVISGVGRDITQEVILEQKLWDTEEDRHSTLEFALRTSLGLVKGYVYTLEAGESLGMDQRKRYMHIVLDEIDNLSKIVDDLLDYRRLEENSLTMEDELTDLNECVAMAIGQFAEETERREIEMKVTIPEEIAPIHLPPDALMRILMNLIQNAIHHTMHSGKIEVIVNDSDDYIDISVRDNGMGIPEKDLPYIFEKYYRGGGSTDAAAPGAGLGLAVTKILVSALGGKIWATSKPGEQTEFRFVLPRRVGVDNSELSDTEVMQDIVLSELQ